MKKSYSDLLSSERHLIDLTIRVDAGILNIKKPAQFEAVRNQRAGNIEEWKQRAGEYRDAATYHGFNPDDPISFRDLLPPPSEIRGR